VSKNLLQIVAGSKSYGTKELFHDVAFAINENEHVGVIGPNGAGKTTLFRIITGEEDLTSGEVVRSRDLRLGYLAQEASWTSDQTLEDYLSDCIKPLWDLRQLGIDLGLSDEVFTKPIRELSGGYRMRCKLLHLIGTEPNLLLLDEPTNYLDLETLLVLEKFLQDFSGSFLLISHDREFLRRTTDHTLEVESGDTTKFPGNIDDYFEEKQTLREQLEKQAYSQDKKKKAIMDFVNRFGAKATKARQAQSKLRSLQKMEKIEIKSLPVSATIPIPVPNRTGKKTLTVKNLDLGYGDVKILKDINLELVRGEHLGVVGFNGAGKTTFLKGLAKAISPISGSIEYGLDVSIGYYAQHVSDELDLSKTVFDELTLAAHKHVTFQEILDLAGALLFSGKDVYKEISVLSGGEKSRVSLAKILLKKVPVLLLDEPTNHLDFQTVEALTQALKTYLGTLVVVSHDRGFIARVANRILEVRNGQVLTYPGTYDEYLWSLENGSLSKLDDIPNSPTSIPISSPPTPSITNTNLKAHRKEIRETVKILKKTAREKESIVNKTQNQIDELSRVLETKLGEEAGKITFELSKLHEVLDNAEAAWLLALEKIEDLESKI